MNRDILLKMAENCGVMIEWTTHCQSYSIDIYVFGEKSKRETFIQNVKDMEYPGWKYTYHERDVKIKTLKPKGSVSC